MDKLFDKYQDQAYAAMRIVVGLLFLSHGAQKVFGLWGGLDGAGARPPLMSQMGIGGLIELICGLAIALGVFSGWAAFLASGTMAVGYFQFHQAQGTLPIQNGGELAVVYAFLFLFIATRGAGAWSLGTLLKRP